MPPIIPKIPKPFATLRAVLFVKNLETIFAIISSVKIDDEINNLKIKVEER